MAFQYRLRAGYVRAIFRTNFVQHEPVYERAINSYILYCRIIALHYGKIKYQYIYDVFSGFHL